ncbi:transglycosylase SLT domain-containing protein, partial [Albidovulum sp.]
GRGDAPDRSPGGPAEVNRLIAKYAALYDVPEDLVHRVVRRESNYNPAARNGPYYGLMQIHPQTARGMGYRGGPEGLLDPDTNLRYAVKYLRGAWIVAEGDRDDAVMWYARGYYYEAKRKGLLRETGLAS